MTILLIEQNAKLALEVCHRGYVMESGEITLSGDAKSAAARSGGARRVPRRGGVSATGRPEREHRAQPQVRSEHRGALRKSPRTSLRAGATVNSAVPRTKAIR